MHSGRAGAVFKRARKHTNAHRSQLLRPVLPHFPAPPIIQSTILAAGVNEEVMHISLSRPQWLNRGGWGGLLRANVMVETCRIPRELWGGGVGVGGVNTVAGEG